MTRTLLLMRHSYAASEDSVRDFDRPLTDAGRRLARETGQLLKELNLVPNLIVTSAAARTVTTGQCVAEQFEPAVSQVAREDLYQARSSAYLPAIQSEVEPETSTILAIGHNPGIGTLITNLADRRFPVSPATVGVYTIDTEDWFEVPTLNDRNASMTHLIINGQLNTDY